VLRSAPVQYDQEDVRRGKGAPTDAVSFFELAEGATVPVASDTLVLGNQ